MRIKQKQLIESQLNLEPEDYNSIQLSLYTGIPSVEHRWAVLKLGFYHKLHHLNSNSVLHEWANIPHIKHYSLFKQFIKHREQWLEPRYELIDDKWAWIDPFTHYPKVKQIRPMIVQKQNLCDSLGLHTKV